MLNGLKRRLKSLNIIPENIEIVSENKLLGITFIKANGVIWAAETKEIRNLKEKR